MHLEILEDVPSVHAGIRARNEDRSPLAPLILAQASSVSPNTWAGTGWDVDTKSRLRWRDAFCRSGVRALCELRISGTLTHHRFFSL